MSGSSLLSRLRALLAMPTRVASLQAQLDQLMALTTKQDARMAAYDNAAGILATQDLIKLGSDFRRNVLPNSDAALQKLLQLQWGQLRDKPLTHADLSASGFRVFSQNDEDGMLLRLFAHIGETNRCVVEIGSNCSDSDIGIPENLSTNLIVNHGWNGTVCEIDSTECERLRYFFARHFSTKHFHWAIGDRANYYAPQVVNDAVTPENINSLLRSAGISDSPDLLILDIDGGDFNIVEAFDPTLKPRVLVLEFEKRFRDRWSVYQPADGSFSKRWAQSGATSLSAWVNLLSPRNYSLISTSLSGFNAIFVHEDALNPSLRSVSPTEVFDTHPIFSRMPDDFWLIPDESWKPTTSINALTQ